MTVADGLSIVAGIALALWVSEAPFSYAKTFIRITGTDAFTKRPMLLTGHWCSLILHQSQPMASVLTLTCLFARVLRPRPGFRRLFRQPGFTASVAASVAILIGGGLNYATTDVKFADPGLNIQGYASVALLPHGSEPGVAIAACWFLLALGKRWRAERSWIDRFGRLLGIFWISMIVVARFSPRI